MARIKYYDESTGQWIYADQAITAGGGSAPPYKLPVAAAGTLGGIQADAQLDEDTQPVRIGQDNKLYTKPGQAPDPYKLPTASESELGGVKVSAPDPKTNDWFRVFIDGAGKLHTLTHAAEADTFGCIKADEAPVTATAPIYIGTDGKLKYIPAEIPKPPKPYKLPVASADKLGGVMAATISTEEQQTYTQPVKIDTAGKMFVPPAQAQAGLSIDTIWTMPDFTMGEITLNKDTTAYKMLIMEYIADTRNYSPDFAIYGSVILVTGGFRNLPFYQDGNTIFSREITVLPDKIMISNGRTIAQGSFHPSEHTAMVPKRIYGIK